MPGRAYNASPLPSGHVEEFDLRTERIPQLAGRSLSYMQQEARRRTDQCIARLSSLLHAEDERVALMAAKELLDRGYGRPQGPAGDDAAGTTVDGTTGYVIVPAKVPHP